MCGGGGTKNRWWAAPAGHEGYGPVHPGALPGHPAPPDVWTASSAAQLPPLQTGWAGAEPPPVPSSISGPLAGNHRPAGPRGPLCPRQQPSRHDPVAGAAGEPGQAAVQPKALWPLGKPGLWLVPTVPNTGMQARPWACSWSPAGSLALRLPLCPHKGDRAPPLLLDPASCSHADAAPWRGGGWYQLPREGARPPR